MPPPAAEPATFRITPDRSARQAVVERHELALARLAARPDEAVAMAVAIPFCAAHCLHCDRSVHAAQGADVVDAYVDNLLLEAHLLGRRTGTRRPVRELHFGGGTANDLSSMQLVRLVGGLHDEWQLPAHEAMSIDCDPRRASRTQLDLLCELGFQRVSF
ncbi:MAG: hypothetical protein U1F50_22200, partial [Rubrivivax sp.]